METAADVLCEDSAADTTTSVACVQRDWLSTTPDVRSLVEKSSTKPHDI